MFVVQNLAPVTAQSVQGRRGERPAAERHQQQVVRQRRRPPLRSADRPGGRQVRQQVAPRQGRPNSISRKSASDRPKSRSRMRSGKPLGLKQADSTS
jgi:hypothetical protein